MHVIEAALISNLNTGRKTARLMDAGLPGMSVAMPRRRLAIKAVSGLMILVAMVSLLDIAARAEGGALSPVVVKLQGGRAPFRFLANGKALPAVERRRTSRWVPEGEGFSTLTVIGATGRAASVKVFVE